MNVWKIVIEKRNARMGGGEAEAKKETKKETYCSREERLMFYKLGPFHTLHATPLEKHCLAPQVFFTRSTHGGSII
jgi:hypothetical protein